MTDMAPKSRRAVSHTGLLGEISRTAPMPPTRLSSREDRRQRKRADVIVLQAGTSGWFTWGGCPYANGRSELNVCGWGPGVGAPGVANDSDDGGENYDSDADDAIHAHADDTDDDRLLVA